MLLRLSILIFETETFTFGNHVDLATADMIKIRVYKGKMFGKKDKGEIVLPLAMFSAKKENTKETKWHVLQKINKMKSIRGSMGKYS